MSSVDNAVVHGDDVLLEPGALSNYLVGQFSSPDCDAGCDGDADGWRAVVRYMRRRVRELGMQVPASFRDAFFRLVYPFWSAGGTRLVVIDPECCHCRDMLASMEGCKGTADDPRLRGIHVYKLRAGDGMKWSVGDAVCGFPHCFEYVANAPWAERYTNGSTGRG